MKIYCAYDAIEPIEKVLPNPKNPNNHPESQVEILAKIIQKNGWRQPITVSNRSGYIVKGHGRLLAAKELGCKEVPVDYQDYDSEEAEYADLIADNKIAELSEIDNDAMARIFQDIDFDDVEITGYTDEEVQDLLGEAIGEDLTEEVPEAEDIKEETVTELGDLWVLGRHRLKCGDSTKEADVLDLVGGGGN